MFVVQSDTKVTLNVQEKFTKTLLLMKLYCREMFSKQMDILSHRPIKVGFMT